VPSAKAVVRSFFLRSAEISFPFVLKLVAVGGSPLARGLLRTRWGQSAPRSSRAGSRPCSAPLGADFPLRADPRAPAPWLARACRPGSAVRGPRGTLRALCLTTYAATGQTASIGGFP
jgi:hypothetical protein